MYNMPGTCLIYNVIYESPECSQVIVVLELPSGYIYIYIEAGYSAAISVYRGRNTGP